MPETAACCLSESGAYCERLPGSNHVDLSSLTEAMSNAGSRCTCVSPASASASRWRVPFESTVNALYVPTNSPGHVGSLALKSRT